MLCRKCMTVMMPGTTYEQGKERFKPSAKRFYKCEKCKDKIYTNEPNFQEYLHIASKKDKNK